MTTEIIWDRSSEEYPNILSICLSVWIYWLQLVENKGMNLFSSQTDLLHISYTNHDQNQIKRANPLIENNVM